MTHVSVNHIWNREYSDEHTLARHWGWMLVLGILMVVLGIIAIGMPWIVALTIDFLIGWLLVIGGLVHIVDSVRSHKWSGFILELLTGILYLVVGLMLLIHPLRGVLTLTMLLAIFFILEGIFKIVLAIEVRKIWSWGWLLANGILALILGGLIWSHWPGSGAWAIGLLVGIDLLFGGWSMILLALAARHPAFPSPSSSSV